MKIQIRRKREGEAVGVGCDRLLWLYLDPNLYLRPLLSAVSDR